MKGSLILLSACILLGATSCKKCWSCKRYAEIEVNGQIKETDNYFIERVCNKSDKEEIELEGFVCNREL